MCNLMSERRAQDGSFIEQVVFGHLPDHRIVDARHISGGECQCVFGSVGSLPERDMHPVFSGRQLFRAAG
jgi:hypothetical protein